MSFIRSAYSKVPTGVKSAIHRLLKPYRVFKTSGLDRPSPLRIKTFGRFEVAFRSNTDDEAALTRSLDRDALIARLPTYRPNETDIIIDVGAHIGTFALLAASKVPRGRVYAIEPCEDSFNLLRINASLNKLQNLLTFHVALADDQGICKLHYEFGNQGHSIVHPFSNYGELVECCTLQNFLDENRIGTCDLIKFNCEGAEFPILLSSPPDLLKRIKNMLVLYHSDLWTKDTLEELLAHLYASGFECKNTGQYSERRGWIFATYCSDHVGARTAFSPKFAGIGAIA